MLPKYIFQNANLKVDDNIDSNTLFHYFNQGVNRINVECGLKLPSLTNETITQDYIVSDKDFVNDNIGYMLATYLASMIKQSEGYPNNDNTFYSEYLALQLQFYSKFRHLIKDEYQLTPQENGAISSPTKNQKPQLLTRTRIW